MNLEVATRLHDAATACGEIELLVSETTESEFYADRVLNLAIWKLIEIVGEALRRAEIIDPALGERIPNLRKIIDTRNRIVHGYESVDLTMLWSISQTNIPPLRTILESLLLEAPDIASDESVHDPE